MVREMKLVDIMKDIDLNTNESKFQKAIAGWLQDVENAHHNHEISSPATESSSATASTSSNVLKEENFFQVKVAERLISSQGYRSVCTGEVYHVDSGGESSVNKQKGKERQNDLFPSLRVTVSV
jgi:predicted nucleic acid-binding protein